MIGAVRRFEREHGRLPRALEFFRWRYEAAVDAPTQDTVYKLFPGGWAEVLGAVHQPTSEISQELAVPSRPDAGGSGDHPRLRAGSVL